ncbi:tyrosine-type recombinase/integrase [Dysgonomonas sp. GY617]|uniref:tyrosine-type recombinase/integrase n=1 Tax=Dysgonomonas sp. GY617 TaxID=2780420 RepID=UPI001884090E|nr:tyrosine-type recombinase/integrase [Dysgonomonas sp. GY617]MBF0577385.1 tyrosine-type recombinase/integrase [Dysgonomonas sp. GY617]
MNTDLNTFDELVLAASRHLQNLGRSEESIRIYLWAWGRFCKYMENSKIKECSEGVVMKYIEATYGQSEVKNLTHYQKDHLRQCLCLVQFSEAGSMPIYIDRKPKYEIVDFFRPIVDEYLEHKRKMRVSEITLRAHRLHLYQFSEYLVSRDLNSIAFLSPLELTYYASEIYPDAPASKNANLIVIRRFLNYLYNKEYIKRNLFQLVPKDNYRQQAKLPSVYSKEEIRQIFDSIDRSTTIGKRNYAVILLAVRLGMRASDISTLEFRNIKWAANQISFTQMKTGRNILLPLPTDVGESIINYLKNSRPVSEEKRIFLSPRNPHKPIDSEAISHLVNKIIVSSGVKVGNRKSGPHALRHSMANFMINGGTTLPVIAEVLGHASIQTSMNYLRIDVESMRQCASEIPLVPVSFYEQKGGEFYG